MRLLVYAICLMPVALVAADDDERDLPEGNGKETFVQMCSNCHALKRVVKTRYPKKFWESVVDDMVSRGAEGTEEDASVVISYLTRNYGKPLDINKATAKQIQAGLSFSAAHAELIVRHRTENGPFKSFDDLQKVPGLSQKLLDEQKKNILY
jgi:competence ComEA-like helix-hairpin-helix protein